MAASVDDLDPEEQAKVEPEDLYGEDCTECGTEIDSGSIRWSGFAWEHKNPDVHPQAGHHAFDAVEAAAGGEDGGV